MNRTAKTLMFLFVMLVLAGGVCEAQTWVVIGGPPSATGGDVWMLSAAFPERRIQLLYTQAEIVAGGWGGGQALIQAMSWLPATLNSAPAAQPITQLRIVMGHTNLVALATVGSLDANFTGGQTIVYNAAYNIPPTVADGVWEDLPAFGITPFTWNGVDNVIVDIYHTGPNGANDWGGVAVGAGRNAMDLGTGGPLPALPVPPLDGNGDGGYGGGWTGTNRFAARLLLAPTGVVVGGGAAGGSGGGGGSFCVVGSGHNSDVSIPLALLLAPACLWLALAGRRKA